MTRYAWQPTPTSPPQAVPCGVSLHYGTTVPVTNELATRIREAFVAWVRGERELALPDGAYLIGVTNTRNA